MEHNVQGCGEQANSQEMNGNATEDTPCRHIVCSAVAEHTGAVIKTADLWYIALHPISCKIRQSGDNANY